MTRTHEVVSISLLAAAVSLIGLVGAEGYRKAKIRAPYEQAVATIGSAITDESRAVIICDWRGVVTYWSPGAERMFRMTSDQAVGFDVGRLVPAESLAKHREAIADSVSHMGVDGTIVVEVTALRAKSESLETYERFPVQISLRSTEVDGELRFIAEINERSEAGP